MTLFGFVRFSVRLFALASSAVVLGLSIYLLVQLMPGRATWNILAIVASGSTILTLVSMMITDLFRTNGFSTWTTPEVVWLGVLWAFWLATASYEASVFGNLGRCKAPVGCSRDPACVYERKICRTVVATEAFSFISWIILMGLFIYMLVLAIRGRPSFTGRSQGDSERGSGDQGVLIEKNVQAAASIPIPPGPETSPPAAPEVR